MVGPVSEVKVYSVKIGIKCYFLDHETLTWTPVMPFKAYFPCVFATL